MPHYEFFCHACKKAFSKDLSLLDYEEGEDQFDTLEVAYPRYLRPIIRFNLRPIRRVEGLDLGAGSHGIEKRWCQTAGGGDVSYSTRSGYFSPIRINGITRTTSIIYPSQFGLQINLPQIANDGFVLRCCRTRAGPGS
jgi:hypothetical protein